MKKTSKRLIAIVTFAMVLNVVCSCVFALTFAPGGKQQSNSITQDDEYTVELLDLQFNTILPHTNGLMCLDLDEEFGGYAGDEFEDDAELSLIGSIRINHNYNGKVEVLKEKPVVNLVNGNGDIVATTEVDTYEDGDVYYLTIYDLDVSSNESYRVLVNFTDNYGNEVERYATYKGDFFISEYANNSLSYRSVNDTVSISFNLDSEQEKIMGDLDGNGNVDTADAAVALNLFKYRNATEEDIAVGDMDGNGVIDTADAAEILNIFKYKDNM